MKDLLASHGIIPVRPEVIDSSMLKCYIDCPAKFWLRYVCGLTRATPDRVESAKFDWGTCWHAVMEAYYKAIMEGREEERLVDGIKALAENYPTYIRPDTDRHKRSQQRMAEAFFAHDEKYFKGQDREYTILRLEQFFDVYDEEVDLRWAGRVDQVRRRRLNGKARVWDFKTSSSMGDNYFTQHELGFQFPGYVWAVDHLMPGEGVVEITVDVMYMIAASFDFFRRTFRFDAVRKQEWVRNVQRILGDMEYGLDSHLYNPDWWIKNWNECVRYGKCQFLGVHNVSPHGDTRLRILGNDFRIARWDPRKEPIQLEGE